nr:MAG TPA: minor tail protein [Caudoviricetes sp.]
MAGKAKIGAGIALDGEKEFKSAISGINKDLTVLKSALEKNKSEFEANGKSIEALNDKLKILSKQYDTQKSKTDTLKAALENAQKNYKSCGEKIEELKTALNAAEKEMEEMKESSSETAESIEKQNKKIADLKEALNKTEKSYQTAENKVKDWQTSLNKAEAELNKTKKAIDDTESEVENFTFSTEKAEEATEKLSDSFTVAKGIMANLIAEGIKVLTTELINLTKEAVTFSAEFESAMNALQVQTGMSSKEMEKYNGIMKEMYNKNYGESFDDIAQSIATVAQNSKEVDPAKIQELTEGALTLRDAFGFEVNETMRAANMLMDQFGISGEEAYNLIAQGAQNGLNKNGDLLDTINEYAVHFKQTGRGAEDFFNMLENGAEEGTFSVDKLGDAWKEFGIRAKDTTNTTTEAYEILGLNADEMRAKFAAGGESAKQATDTILTALFSMDDAVKQNQAGVDLFGTMWEDLGADAIKALSDTNGEITTTKNSLEEINKVQYSGFEHELEQLKREFKTSLSKPLAEEVIPQVKKFFDTLKNSGSLQSFSNILGDVAGIFLELANKLLPPALKLLEGILKNFKWLAPAVGAVVAAFLTYKKASKAVEGTNTIVNLLAKGISNVCGGIDLQIAKQTILNGLKSPWAALAIGVGTLITGITLLCSNMETESSLIRKQREEAEEAAKAWQELIDKQNEKIATGLGELEQTQQLASELETLVDANGRVKEGYEARANFIINELNEAIGTEMELVEGQIQNYDEFKNKITELINTKRAQIIMEAQEEAYKEAVLNLEKEVNNQRQLAIDIEKKKQEIANETSAHERNNLTQDLREMEDTYETKQGIIDGYYNTISDYELNSVRLASGNAEEIAKIETSVTASKATGISDRRTLLEQERASQEEYLNHLKEIYKGTNDELELQQIESAQKKLDATNAELQSMTSTINTGFPSILSAWGTGMSNAVNEVSAKAPFLKSAMAGNMNSTASGVSENSWKISDALGTTMTDGEQRIKDERENFNIATEWAVGGVQLGIGSAGGVALGMIGSLATGLVARFKKDLEINSPSKIMARAAQSIPEGIAKGIKDNTSVAMQATSNMSKSIKSEWELSMKGFSVNTFTDNIGHIQAGLNRVSNLDKTLKLSIGVPKSVNTQTVPSTQISPTFVIQIDKFVNNRPGDVQSFAQELDFYARNANLARGLT